MKKGGRSNSGKKRKAPKRFSGTSSSGKKKSNAAIMKLIEEGLQFHRQGNVLEAESRYEQVLALEPENADALHLSGLIKINRGDNQGGLAQVEKAVSIFGDFPQMFNTLGLGYRNLHRFPEAEKAFRKSIQLNKDFIDAYLGLSVMFRMMNNLDEAEKVCEDALKVNADHLGLLTELGTLRHGQKNFAEAEKVFRRVLEIDPGNIFTLNNLGVMYLELELGEKAAEVLKTLTEVDPNYTFGWNNLGLAYRSMGKIDDAMMCHRRAVQLDPNYVDARFNIGRLNMDMRRFEEAKQELIKLTQDFPDNYMAFAALGDLFLDQNEFENAEKFYQGTLRASPDGKNFFAFSNLAVVFRELQRFDEAEDAARKAIEMDPSNSEPYNTLGWILHDMGRHAEAEEIFRAGLKVNPKSMKIHSNLLFLLTYQMNLPHNLQLSESSGFSELHMPQDKDQLIPLQNEITPYRPLRIAYTSADFKRHVVRNFIQPVLENHDKSKVEVYLYGQIARPDEITEEIKRLGHWRSTVEMSDLAMANQIREDKIDVLIDLAGHSGGNRLGVYLYKPAPVQAEYLGYIATTGLKEMDYRITDHVMNPEDTKELHSEELYRLDRCYKVYEPAPNEPDVNLDLSPPEKLIFGSLNRISKLPDECIELWCDVLKAVEGSKLLLARHELKFEENRQTVYSLFEKFGIGADRLIFDDTYGYNTHMEIYNKIDIALDPVPVSGGATTCEALWMGVPVLTLQGEPFRGRISSSLLTAIGLADWVTTTKEEFVQRAVKFAADYDYRLELRKKQRDMMKNSELGDAKALAEALEDAYIDMWNRYVAENS